MRLSVSFHSSTWFLFLPQDNVCDLLNLGGKESTLKFALRAFFLIAEYTHYKYAKE